MTSRCRSRSYFRIGPAISRVRSSTSTAARYSAGNAHPQTKRFTFDGGNREPPRQPKRLPPLIRKEGAVRELSRTETRNSKLETRNPKPETRNSKLETLSCPDDVQ